MKTHFRYTSVLHTVRTRAISLPNYFVLQSNSFYYNANAGVIITQVYATNGNTIEKFLVPGSRSENGIDFTSTIKTTKR